MLVEATQSAAMFVETMVVETMAVETMLVESSLVEITLMEITLAEITLVKTTLVLVGNPLYFMYEGVDDAQEAEFPEIVSQIA